MSYKEKPIIRLYKYDGSQFVMQAMIDDFQECSFEHNIYEAGTFTITINYNIPNSQLFQRGYFVQFGNNPKNFGEIVEISDAIGQEGKGSQLRTITGRDSRYILRRRVIKDMNANGLWEMTDKGEIVLRNLIDSQCGTEAEAKRQLPITNNIPSTAEAIGKEVSVSEQFSNLYEVCKTVAIQSEIGWRLNFNGAGLELEVFAGADRSETVRFDTDYESLANGVFTDTSDSYSNAVYVGGKGQNDERDIYEGESAIGGESPSGLDRFECYDNQSSMTSVEEYETEALAMLTQYGQTITLEGNGLAKCPYVYEEQYFEGDKITVAFSGKSAVVQILSVTEHWAWGAYDLSFSFGKPQNNLSDQMQLILRQIQKSSRKESTVASVRWYDLPDETSMPKEDTTFGTIGFTGNISTGMTFTLYYNSNKTGSKQYNVYIKNLTGTGKLTLTTGVSGASSISLNVGTYCATVYVDEDGNVTTQGTTVTDSVTLNNMQSVSSNAVSKSLSYSTTEQLTGGKWIDGRPIYRRVISGSWTSGQSITVPFSMADNNVREFTKINLFIKAGSGGSYMSGYYQSSNDYLNYYYGNNNFFIRRGSSAPPLNITYYFTIEYTKTTD
jgi:hypothetical protein